MIRKNKILYVIGSFNIGGCEKHLLTLIKELKFIRSNYDISLICLSNKGQLKKKFYDLKIDIVDTFLDHFSNKFFSLLKLPFIFFYILYYAFKNKDSIIHFYLPESYIIGGLAGSFAKHNRMIMSRRSLNNYQNKYPKTFKSVEYFLHKKMRLILGNSREVIKQLNKSENVPSHKLKLIHNGTKIFDKINEYEIKINHQRKKNVQLIIIANLIEYKGHFDLLKSCLKLKNKNWILKIVGEDRNNFKRKLVKFVNNNNLHNKVFFLDYQKDTKEILQNSDIGILASHEEGFSNSLLEYMSFSLPVVVTDVGGNKDAVKMNKNGLLVKPKNILQMSKAIDQLITDQNMRKMYGKKSYEIVKRHFSLDSMIKKYTLIYDNIFNSKI